MTQGLALEDKDLKENGYGHSNDLFDLSIQDSLYVQFWNAGGFGAGASTSTRYNRFAGQLLR